MKSLHSFEYTKFQSVCFHLFPVPERWEEKGGKEKWEREREGGGGREEWGEGGGSEERDRKEGGKEKRTQETRGCGVSSGE